MYVDPTGMDQCVWDDGTFDDPAEDGGATEGECSDQGGSWYVGPDLYTGGTIYTESWGSPVTDPTYDGSNGSSFNFGGPVLSSMFSGGAAHGTNTLNKPPYSKTMSCASSASQVMGAVEGNFPQFGNYSRWGGLESVTFFPPAGMGPGSTIPIKVNVFGTSQNLSVTVQSLNSQSMTFTTNPGHLIYPGSITFSSSPASLGSINFNINIQGTVAKPAEFYFGGSDFEDAQWNHFLGQVGAFCKAGG
jgi:hypothetical protein